MTLGSFDHIPLIDLTEARSGDLATTAERLGRALEEVGFVYLTGHSVPAPLQEAVWRQSRAFHALPLNEKMQLKLNANFRGYIPIDSSTIVTSSVAKVTKPNQSESLMLMHEVARDDPRALAGKPLQGPNLWPPERLVPGFRQTMESYVSEMTGLARLMLRLVALALRTPYEELARHFEEPTTFLRLLHYPSQRMEEGLFGSAPHTDYGFITLLAQDQVGGLEVRNKAGDWIAAPPIAGSFVMNVGDILARWSNGRFSSTPHRVINRSGRERYSVPFFFDPDMESRVEVLPGCLADGPALYPPVIYGDYLMERIDKNYAARKGLTRPA